MKTFLLAVTGLLVASGCTPTRWRAQVLESVSNAQSKVFAVDKAEFGGGLEVAKYRLSNGLKVIILEDHSAPVFAYHTWFNVGSRDEREGITGIAHLFEHLMFKETKNHPEGHYDRVLEEQGGSINAATYVDWTFYRASVPKEAFPLLPPLEADRMQNMVLNDAQVNAEREVVANERRFRTDNNPQGAMYEALYKTAFREHPYYWPVIGWMKDIQAISTQDCIQFHRTYYAPNNATVVVVGDVETPAVLRAINEAYGAIPPSELPQKTFPVEPPQETERRLRLEKPIPAEKLLLGYRTPDAAHPDFMPLEVAHAVLYGGKSSRLFRRLITESQVAASAGGWVNHTKDPGLYIMNITLRPERKAEEAEKIIAEELARLQKDLVSASELEKAQNRYETSFWTQQLTADQRRRAWDFTRR